MKNKIKIAIIKRDLKVLSVWTLGVIAGGSAVLWYFVTPTLKQDIIFEQKNTIQVIETVEAKERDTIEDMMATIYERESSNGKNNFSKCEAIGKVNGIGYGIPGNGDFVCFDSHEDEMTALKGWLVAKRAAGMSDNAILCLYSGNNYVNCKK